MKGGGAGCCVDPRAIPSAERFRFARHLSCWMPALKPFGRSCALACLMGLAACGPQPACKQIESTGRSITSWDATAQMVARRWIAGDVPTAYARNTLEKGAQQVRSAAMKLARAPAPADPVAQVARARYEHLAAMLSEIDAAIGKNDKATVARIAAGLPPIKQHLGALRTRCQARKQAS